MTAVKTDDGFCHQVSLCDPVPLMNDARKQTDQDRISFNHVVNGVALPRRQSQWKWRRRRRPRRHRELDVRGHPRRQRHKRSPHPPDGSTRVGAFVDADHNDTSREPQLSHQLGTCCPALKSGHAPIQFWYRLPPLQRRNIREILGNIKFSPL